MHAMRWGSLMYVLLWTGTGALAEIPVSGTIENGTVWTQGNTYVVTGDIRVAGLTVEPGVRVEFAGFHRFEVLGVLVVQGTPDEPVVFTNAPDTDGWDGIFFNYSTPASELDYCIVQDSGSVGLWVDHAEVRVRHSVVERSADRGIIVDGGILTLEDSTIRKNESEDNGAGIYAVNDATVALTRCSVTDNKVSAFGPDGGKGGGGLYSDSGVVDLTHCYIRRNEVHASFPGNMSAWGGGIYSGGELNLLRCTVSENRVFTDGITTSTSTRYLTALGGGILSLGPLWVRNSLVFDNRATTGIARSTSFGFAYSRPTAGGIYVGGEAILENTIVANNEIDGSVSGSRSFFEPRGNGLYVYNGTVALTNCAVAFNRGLAGGLTVNGDEPVATLNNTIVYFNDQAEIEVLSGTVGATYCDIQGGFAGEGNIDGNPIFNSDRDLRILPGSPCIDAGDPDPAMDDACLPPSLGTGRNDIGAHGGPGACLGEPTVPDCNGNRVDDADDIANGTSSDCDGNGFPDECDISAGRALDANGDGVPDGCQRFAVTLASTGEACWTVILENEEPVHGGEIALAYDAAVLELPEVAPGTALEGRVDPAGGFFVDTTPRFNTCEGDLGGVTVGWLIDPDPGTGQLPLENGSHEVLQLCFHVRNDAPPGDCAEIRFVDCLGPEWSPARNIVTSGSGESLPLFTQDAEFCPGIFARGDANDDGRFDISDPIVVLFCLFLGENCPGCLDAADANDDGRVDVSDAVYLLGWRFLDGPPPGLPFFECGRDPTEDPLGFCLFASCQ